MTGPDTAAVYRADFVVQVLAFVDEHREMLLASLDGLTEEEARARLVPSKTTLLGIVKHADEGAIPLVVVLLALGIEF